MYFTVEKTSILNVFLEQQDFISNILFEIVAKVHGSGTDNICFTPGFILVLGGARYFIVSLIVQIRF